MGVVYFDAEEEIEFEYKDNGTKAPKFWGDLKKEWEACKSTGDHNQSPIDICTKNVKPGAGSGDLIRDYKLADAELKNRGHDISVRLCMYTCHSFACYNAV